MTVSLETLLRETRLTYGHIQLFRSDDGWQASICHYEPIDEQTRYHQTDGKVCADPVDALRKALLEDDRKTRDLERRYAAAPKMPQQIDIEDAIAATIPDYEDILG